MKNDERFEIEFNEFTREEMPEAPKPPKKRRTFLRVIAGIAAIAVVSAGSIEIYSSITNKNATSAEVSTETTTEAQTTSSSQAVSLSNTSSTSTETNSVSEIAEKLLPSVVGIKATFATSTQENSMYNYYYGYGDSDSSSDSSSSDTAEATGTGIVYSSDGYIVTNAHVINDEEYNYGEAQSVTVVLNDQTEYDATIVAYDTEADIAVLKIDATGLTAAEFGSSDDLSVGDSVIAIGNPLGLDLFNTVTSGIISGLNREITINDTQMELIQTDAAINSGNSGGPLINSEGKVIGINSAKMSSNYSSTTIEGIGFAIPSNYALEVINDLINYGYVTGRAQIGISCRDISESVAESYNLPTGVYVIGVTEGSAAETAGIQQSDIITAVNGTEVSSYSELNAIKKDFSAGDSMTLTIYRNGETMDITLTLDEATTES